MDLLKFQLSQYQQDLQESASLDKQPERPTRPWRMMMHFDVPNFAKPDRAEDLSTSATGSSTTTKWSKAEDQNRSRTGAASPELLGMKVAVQCGWCTAGSRSPLHLNTYATLMKKKSASGWSLRRKLTCWTRQSAHTEEAATWISEAARCRLSWLKVKVKCDR